jgi:CheY-like chemotaxis protein
MGEAEERRVAKLLVKRLGAMGVDAQLVPGGRSVRGRMSLRSAPFPLFDGPAEFRELLFATAGTQIKCLEPAPLFQLPLLPIAGCTSASMIEDRVRTAWAAHGRALRDAHRALRALGVATAVEPGGATLAFPIGVEDRDAAARCLDATRVSLPSRGPLTGVALGRARDRVLARPANVETASDVEIALTNHLERLGRAARRPRVTVAPMAQAPALDAQPAREKPVGSGHRLLLVGPLLGRDSELIAGLRRLGHRTRIEYSIEDAVEAFASQSFELVLADTHIGRAEGMELVPALADLPGIERLPVVLVDERSRESVREAAQRVGAAGYLAHPVDANRISAGLDRLLHGRGKRRFARLGHSLDVQRDGSDPGFTIAIARLGLSVRTARELRANSIHRWTIRLSELGENMRVDAQTIYRIPAAGPEDPTAGLRIRSFPDRNESLWIDYLTALTDPKDDPSS